MAAERVVIIGSGPAGWTAAIYAARANLEPLCLIGVPRTNPAPVLPGGQLMLTTDVENYPGFPEGISGPEMMGDFQKQAERFGTRSKQVDVVKCDFSARPFKLECSDGETVEADSVIIATGATANWLGLDNELRLATNGGGGDSSMEEAAYLTKFASTVHVIHRRDSFRASKVMQARVLDAGNAEVHWNKQVVDVLGDARCGAIHAQGSRATKSDRDHRL